jgi:hypothetical protein
VGLPQLHQGAPLGAERAVYAPGSVYRNPWHNILALNPPDSGSQALPWYTSVRLTLEDPAYAPWFLTFKPGGFFPNGSYHVPTCDDNYHPPLCSKYYHDQSQTPGYPSGDGHCAAPACDVGSVPVGEYIWDPRAANVSVKGQTFLQWFVDSYLFGPTGGGSPLVSGFFFDDQWTSSGPTEYEAHAVADMGLNQSVVDELVAAYNRNMAAVYAEVLRRRKFSWQQLWTGQGEGGIGSTCPRPLVHNTTCAADLRKLCNATSPAQTRAMMYAFSPGGCSGDPSKLADPEADLANFLLVRGPYGWLGHGWLGCSRTYDFPAALNADYGEPLGLCSETAAGSGVFTREWSKASVSMDCNTWTPSIVMKQ